MSWRDRNYDDKEPPAWQGSYGDSDPDDDDEADDDHTQGLADSESLDESDRDDYGVEPELIPCPNCRKMILEDAPQCPYCGDYVEADRIAARKPLWLWAAVLLMVFAALYLSITHWPF